MSDPRTSAELTASSDGITVTKRYDEDDYPVPVIEFVIESERAETATVRLVEDVPGGVDTADLGFHPKYGGRFWTTDDGHVTFERDIDAGESYTTVYGIRRFAPDDADQFLTEPTIESVESPRDAEPTESTTRRRSSGASSTRPGDDTAGGDGPSGTGGDPQPGEAHTGRRRAPEEIPVAPDVSVEYDRLTDRDPIGGGGNADVTRATVPAPDGPVTLAIKEPRMSGTLHADAVERLLEEAEMWDKLDDHEHIVGVVDYGSAPIPWIAMEYMDAGHLGERSGELGLAHALWTAIAVTKGVRHAHRRGVAHLDLKPENVLFRSVEGAWDVPKVADWGLSKHLLDHSKSVEGLSPQYAAPEQFDEDFGSPDDITDIYQLGAVFYELFTGRPPFEGKPAKAMYKVLHEQPTPPSEIADVPDALDEILLTALATEKDDRYRTVEYFQDALRELYGER